jgi:hypothetical protein
MFYKKLLYYSYLSIVNLSMFYFRASVFQEERKTLQSYNLILNLQNFSSFFFEVFFSKLAVVKSVIVAALATLCWPGNLRSQKRVRSYGFSTFPPNYAAKKLLKSMVFNIHSLNTHPISPVSPNFASFRRPHAPIGLISLIRLIGPIRLIKKWGNQGE